MTKKPLTHSKYPYMSQLRIALFLSFTAILNLPAYSAERIDFAEIERSIQSLPNAEKETAMNRLQEIIDGINNELLANTESEESKQRQIIIRQAAYDKSGFEKPARIHYVKPEGKESAYSLDFGVTFPIRETQKWQFGPKMEIHRNTDIDEEQHVVKAGAVGSYLFGSPVRFGDDGDITPSFALWADTSLDFVEDRVKDRTSWQLSEVFTPIDSRLALGSKLGSGALRWGIDLFGGFDYESISSGGNNSDGNVLRANLHTGLVLYPLFEKLGTRFEVAFSTQRWKELSQSGEFDGDEDSFRLNKIYSNYYFDKQRRFGVSLSYSDGGDPVNGLEAQEFTQVGVIIKTGDTND